ncbi:MAG: hypothetical protein M0006_08635 [Magnetospirillum sp.]|nr:hypothetical protein [Magnetospirillum sp.]
MGAARILFDLGWRENLIAFLERLVERHPEAAAPLAALSSTLASCGRAKEARATWRKSENVADRQADWRIAGHTPEQRHISHAAADARSRWGRDREQVVFVSSLPRAREQKLSRALMRRGIEVVLIYNHAPHFPVEGSFTRSHQFADCWEALRYAVTLTPLAFHVFSFNADDLAMMFLRHKPGPVIFDVCDVFAGMMEHHRTTMLEWQREGLASADALCCRDLQYRHAVRANGWRKAELVLWFPEYVDHVPERRARSSHRLRAASSGNLHTGDEWGTVGYDLVVTAFLERGVDVHIFAHFFVAGHKEQAYAGLLRLPTGEARVTVQDCLAPDALVEALAGYDVGLLDIRDPCYQKSASLYACGSARQSDYIAAGLVIVGERRWRRLQRFIGRRYGTWLDFEDFLAPGGAERLARLVETARLRTGVAAGYTMDSNSPRLLRFYERVAASVARSGADDGQGKLQVGLADGEIGAVPGLGL